MSLEPKSASHRTKMQQPAINFVLTPSKSYFLVQEQILGAIKRHLAPESFQDSMNKKVEGAVNFGLFIRRPTDYLMSHGVADKNYFWRSNDAGARIADGLKGALVPGQWLKRRLVKSRRLKFDESHVHVVGWPRLDLLLAQQAEYDKKKSTEPRAKKKILWAPTHDFRRRGPENLSTSSYPEFEQYIPALEQKYDVAVSLHPRNRRDKKPTAHSLIEADIVISDFGTLVYEAWALGKQVIFPYWIVGPRIIEYLPNSAEGYIFKNRVGLHADSIDEVHDYLHATPAFDDTLKQFLDDYLEPQYSGCSGKRIADLLLSFSEAR
jgi:CDP-glycerol glycerophosphotransferase (TagB/SpsB family)